MLLSVQIIEVLVLESLKSSGHMPQVDHGKLFWLGHTILGKYVNCKGKVVLSGFSNPSSPFCGTVLCSFWGGHISIQFTVRSISNHLILSGLSNHSPKSCAFRIFLGNLHQSDSLSKSFIRENSSTISWILPASISRPFGCSKMVKHRQFDATLLQHWTCGTLKTEYKTGIAVFLVVKLDAVFCVIIILS